jgi:hypothetical protein
VEIVLTAARVVHGTEPGAVGMGEREAVAGGVIAIAERPRDAAHVRAARGEAAEPVIGVGDALARRRVEPGVELRVPEVVAVIDVALIRRVEPGPVGDDPGDHPIERVILVGDVAIGLRPVVALAQGRAVAGGVVAIFLIVRGVDGASAGDIRGRNWLLWLVRCAKGGLSPNSCTITAIG